MKLDEIINQFTDGERKYLENAYYSRVIDSLYHGANPIKLLDQVLNIVTDQQKMIKELIENKPITYLIDKEDYDIYNEK